jgi:hypothetical protein
MPRDSWLINRLHTQPGLEFFVETIGGQAEQMEAIAKAASIDELFDRLEACGVMLRIDPAQRPTMFHYATISIGEVEWLRRIRNVIRLGHVQAIEADALVFEGARVPLAADTLCIDCTASAVAPRPAPPQPVFQGNSILLQLTRIPSPTFSAALCAYVEAHYEDDAKKNQLCAPVPFPDGPAGYVSSTVGNMMNQFRWSQEPALRTWIRGSRLDGFGKLVAGVAADDGLRQAVLARLKVQSLAAMANAPKLLGR